MTTRLRRHRALFTVTVLAAAVVSVVAATSAAVQATEMPRRGSVLLAVIAADAPSLDPHQENTFATLQPVAPLYSTDALGGCSHARVDRLGAFDVSEQSYRLGRREARPRPGRVQSRQP